MKQHAAILILMVIFVSATFLGCEDSNSSTGSGSDSDFIGTWWLQGMVDYEGYEFIDNSNCFWILGSNIILLNETLLCLDGHFEWYDFVRTSGSNSSIVGSWYSSHGHLKLDLNADGSFYYDLEGNNLRITGEYSSNSTMLQLKFPYSYTYTDNNTLILTCSCEAFDGTSYSPVTFDEFVYSYSFNNNSLIIHSYLGVVEGAVFEKE